MDGLEDQAVAALAGILDQLHKNHTVEIFRSSRDSIMFQICEGLKTIKKMKKNTTGAVQLLILKGGISLNGLFMLQQALLENESIEELFLMRLKSVLELQGAVECCRRQPRIRSLTLVSYEPPTSRRIGEGREVIAITLRDSIFGVPQLYNNNDDKIQGIPTLKELVIVRYPLGAEGAQILANVVAKNATITTLRLLDCV